MMRKLRNAVLAMAMVCLIARAGTKIDDPEAFVRQVYARYLAAEKAHRDYDPPDNIYSRRLRALMDEDKRRAKGEVGCIEFDFWINGQDSELKNVTVTSRAVPGKDDRRIVTAAFTNFRPQQNEFEFQRVNGKWVIDEVRSLRGDQWVLSKILKCW